MSAFAEPVELSGVDSTRVRRDHAGQTLTLGPGGLVLRREGRTVDVSWRGIESIERYPLSVRHSTAKAWAIIGRNGGVIFPHEFDPQWTTGPIGEWLRHHRPDLALPEADSLEVWPLGIPNHQIPYVLLPALAIGLGVGMVSVGASPWTVVLLVLGCVGVVVAMVVSPRWQRIPRYLMYGVSAVPLLILLVGWLLP